MDTHTTIKLNLPWHTGHIGEDEFRREVVFEPNHNQVLTMITPDDPETAAFICKAVNEYESDKQKIAALCDALRNVLTRLDLEPVEAVFPCSAMRESIRQALKLAEGRE